ncbi:hypothetical protein GE300_09775 [Rhodobacteraceae bacterium 2CG4]|uniref:Pentapeptide repeat protein n=1 Tax=Halovulum marinum TaxID=2662447 RepID=A0A6L5Z1F5_9RHOB|nr:hypothetical protein [Halovulum marinum]
MWQRTVRARRFGRLALRGAGRGLGPGRARQHVGRLPVGGLARRTVGRRAGPGLCDIPHFVRRGRTGSRSRVDHRRGRHGVNLRGADLRGVDLRGVVLRGVVLRGVDLRGGDDVAHQPGGLAVLRGAGRGRRQNFGQQRDRDDQRQRPVSGAAQPPGPASIGAPSVESAGQDPLRATDLSWPGPTV